jgi:ABC-type glycerol-3-phosphate transport system substrate-binding protein
MDGLRYHRRRNILKALGSLGIASIAGCIRADPATVGSVSMADSFTFWEMSDSWRRHIKRYTKETGVSIQHTNMGPDAIIKRLQTRLLSGTGAPALAMIEYMKLEQVAATGGLHDLSNWIEETGLKEKYPSWIWEVVTTDDAIYEIPYDIGPTNLFYRKDVWDEHGLNDDIETWDQLIEEGKKLPDDIALLSLPAGSINFYWRMLYRQIGGMEFDKEGRIAFNNEKALRVIRLLNRLGESGLTDSTTSWSQQWFAGFKNGTITGFCTGAWFTSTLKSSLPETAGNWRAMRLPALDKGGPRASNRGGSGLLISKQVNEAKARRAFHFANHTAADAEEMAKLYKNQGNFCAYTPAWEKSVFSQPYEFFGGQKLGEMWIEQAKNIPPYRFTIYSSMFMQFLNQELRNVVYGDQNPQTALKNVVNTMASRTGREVA